MLSAPVAHPMKPLIRFSARSAEVRPRTGKPHSAIAQNRIVRLAPMREGWNVRGDPPPKGKRRVPPREILRSHAGDTAEQHRARHRAFVLLSQSSPHGQFRGTLLLVLEPVEPCHSPQISAVQFVG
ncbi:hypothetical protein SDC9_144113 [bioreactor metagenome]|uniref:Uncharacterized protein n=1 Tax=bioreactor metagenome TaxID=1076179 RepID=A0A645E823_9ZZZZ